MKLKNKKTFFWLIWMLIIFTNVAWSDWIDLTGDVPVRRELDPGEKLPEPVIEVTAFDSEGEPVAEGDLESIYRFVINITLPGFFIEEIEREGEIYSQISIPTFSIQDGQIGKPAIPYKFFPLMIPALTEPIASISDINEMLLENLNVWPAQVPPTDTIYDTTFQKDEDTYNTDQLFPESNIINVFVSLMRNHRMLEIDIAPILVNPFREEGHIAQTLELEIFLETLDSPETRIEEGLSSFSFDKLISSNLKTAPLPVDLERYLIITHRDFWDNRATNNLEEFINWKKRKGNFVTVTLNDDPDLDPVNGKPTCNQICQYLRTTLSSNEYPTYLLFIGTHDLTYTKPSIIACLYDIGDGTPLTVQNRPIDLPYAMRQTTDSLPDCFYGRIPAHSNDELEIMLGKIILMDRNPPSNVDYGYNKVISAGKLESFRVYLETIPPLPILMGQI